MATNYEKYFGTPELAARQMDCVEAEVACVRWQAALPLEQRKGKSFVQLAVEWLKEECDA